MKRALLSTVGAVLALICALIVPSMAAAGEAEEEHRVATFTAKGTNGFTLTVLAIPPSPSPFEEGEGSLGIWVARGKNAGVTYAIDKARVTSTRIEADLGALGKIDLTRTPTGRTKTVPLECAPDHHETLEFDRFEGTIEFHGEEGFTEVEATQAKGGLIPTCGIPEGSVPPGKILPGARLEARHYVGEDFEVDFTVQQKKPGGPTVAYAELMESDETMEVHRFQAVHPPPSTFTFDPQLHGATVKLPAPFSGFGHFAARPGAGELKRGIWTGNLSVDLPGHADVPLGGPGFVATLTHPYS